MSNYIAYFKQFWLLLLLLIFFCFGGYVLINDFYLETRKMIAPFLGLTNLFFFF